MYEFNGALYRCNDELTLNFNVALNNLSNFLGLVKWRKKSIDNAIRVFYGSSKAYQGKRVTVTCSACNMYNLMLSLGCRQNSEVQDNIHVNYTALSEFKNKSLPMVLIWSKAKGYYTQYRNEMPTYKSVYANGKHIVPINH